MDLPRIRPALAALALAALVAPAARADYVTTSMDTSTPVMTFDVPARGVHGESGYVGPNTVSLDGSTPYQAYCTDLFRTISVNDHYAAIAAPLSGLANGDFVAKLFAADAALHDSSPLEHAALQLAIWDAVESGRAGLGNYVDPLAFDPARVDRGADHFAAYADAGKTTLLFGLGSRDLVVYAADGSGVLNRMVALLHAADGIAGPGADVAYIAPGVAHGQGFVSVRAVPEPSSLSLAAIGLAGFLGRRFRRA